MVAAPKSHASASTCASHCVTLGACLLPQWVVLSLLLLALEAGAVGALRHRPYSAHAPKKLFLQRTLRHGPGFLGPSASWDAAAIDSVPAAAALPAEIARRADASAPGAWLALYPVSNVLQARPKTLTCLSPSAKVSVHDVSGIMGLVVARYD